MFTTSFWFSLLFLSRLSASILVSDVYWAQGDCDTAVDPFKNKEGETPCAIVLALLIPCNVNVSDSSTAEINKSACACNLEFYNLLSACAWFCVRKTVDPFYTWSEDCSQSVPLTEDYPYPTSITTDIPSWASKRLSSSGNFDPSVVVRGGWTTLQKVTPVIVGLGVLILVGLIWYLCRTYKRRRYSRRAQDTGNYFGHHRNQSALSYSSTSHLNPDHLSLPVHRIRFFFRGMFPVRERRRNSGWNIDGGFGLSRRSSAAYDPPPRPESGSSVPAPSVHFQNDTPPVSPTAASSPFQTISRWWTSISPSKNRDYQTVHLLPPRKDSKFGTDDDDHPEPAFATPPSQNQASTSRNNRTSEEIPAVVVISDGERESVSLPQTPQPDTGPPSTNHIRPQSLRPNRPGHIVAVEDPSPSQQLISVDVPTTAAITPGSPVFPPPPEILPKTSNDSYHPSRTTFPPDQGSEQTVKPKKKLSPELLFSPSVRAAGYSVPQQPEDPVWISRPDGTSNRPTKTPAREPPSYDQANSSAPPLPRPISPTSLHPYPYTNHIRSTSDLTVLDDFRAPRRHAQDPDVIDAQSETGLSRLSLAVNESTSAPPSENGSTDGDTDFTPVSIVHGSESLKNHGYTPYPSSTILPLSATGALKVDRPPPDKR